MGLAAGLAASTSPASAQDAPPVPGGSATPKPATDPTREVNNLYRNGLPFDDTKDFGDARRGLIASLPEPGIIRNSEGVPVWDLSAYDFIKVTENDDAYRQAAC